MAYGDCAVLPQQQQRHRFSDNIAAPDYNTVFSGNLNSRTFQKLDNPQRGAGDIALAADAERTDIFLVKSIHVLFRRDCLNHFPLVNLFRKRKLDKNPVYLVIRIQPLHQLQKLLLGRLLGKLIRLRLDSDIRACLFLVADIHA